MSEELQKLLDKLNRKNGEAVHIVVNGVDFITHSDIYTGVLFVYAMSGFIVASAEFDSATESVYYSYGVDHDTGEELGGGSSTEIYYQYNDKTDHEVATGLGTYLAALSFA